MTETHELRCLVAEALEVFATTFVLLTEEDPPRTDLAANEVRHAHHRFSDALAAMASES